MYEQINSFLWSFVLGAVLFALYIVLIVTREFSPPTKINIIVSDILFMVIAAFVNFLYAAALTNGTVRFYTVFAECISFAVMYLTVGRMLKKFAAFVFRVCFGVYHSIFDPVCNFIGKSTSKIVKKCKKLLKKTRK